MRHYWYRSWHQLSLGLGPAWGWIHLDQGWKRPSCDWGWALALVSIPYWDLRLCWTRASISAHNCTVSWTSPSRWLFPAIFLENLNKALSFLWASVMLSFRFPTTSGCWSTVGGWVMYNEAKLSILGLCSNWKLAVHVCDRPSDMDSYWTAHRCKFVASFTKFHFCRVV